MYFLFDVIEVELSNNFTIVKKWELLMPSSRIILLHRFHTPILSCEMKFTITFDICVVFLSAVTGANLGQIANLKRQISELKTELSAFKAAVKLNLSRLSQECKQRDELQAHCTELERKVTSL